MFEWEIEFTNLPVSLGNLNFYFDADYFGTGGSFKNGEGYSLVSGGPYSTSLNITNHSSSTLTLYMAFESEATGLGNRRILNPYAQLSYTGGSGADNLRDWAEQFELLF